MPYYYTPEGLNLTEFEKHIFSSMRFYALVDQFVKDIPISDGVSPAAHRDGIILHLQSKITESPMNVHVDTNLLREIREHEESYMRYLESSEVREIPDSWRSGMK